MYKGSHFIALQNMSKSLVVYGFPFIEDITWVLMFYWIYQRVGEEIKSLFRNEFNKFNNTRAKMLDSIYHYEIKIALKSHSCRKNVIILSLCMQRCYGRHNVSWKPRGLSILLHGVISLPDATSHDKWHNITTSLTYIPCTISQWWRPYTKCTSLFQLIRMWGSILLSKLLCKLWVWTMPVYTMKQISISK